MLTKNKNKKPTTTWDAYNDNIRTKYTKKKEYYQIQGESFVIIGQFSNKTE